MQSKGLANQAIISLDTKTTCWQQQYNQNKYIVAALQMIFFVALHQPSSLQTVIMKRLDWYLHSSPIAGNGPHQPSHSRRLLPGGAEHDLVASEFYSRVEKLPPSLTVARLCCMSLLMLKVLKEFLRGGIFCYCSFHLLHPSSLVLKKKKLLFIMYHFLSHWLLLLLSDV